MTKQGKHKFKLIADVGGTNARFAILSDDGTISGQKTLPCAKYDEFVDAVQAFLVDAPSVTEAAVAIANPITGDRIQMTNHAWSFSIEEVRQTLGLHRLIFKNDFTALAMSIPLLTEQQCRQIGGTRAVPNSPIGVLGPGTGLGVSGLIPNADKWAALQGEGGHVSIAPANQREIDLLKQLWKTWDHVSAERLISGMGLENIYTALCALNEQDAESLTAADISNRALSGEDPVCVEALNVFCAMLGSVAGNLALTLGATGGVYIGGGIVPRLGKFFEQSEFRTRFESKGRFTEYLAKLPVYVIDADNPALIGISQAFV